MPHRGRLTLPNLPLHIIQRRNNRQSCFFAGEDYQGYLRWLGEPAAGWVKAEWPQPIIRNA